MDWISVKKQEPPKDGTPFLCFDPEQAHNFHNALIYVVVWDEEESIYLEAGGECYFPWKPTHWMPLPEPPKDEDGMD